MSTQATSNVVDITEDAAQERLELEIKKLAADFDPEIVCAALVELLAREIEGEPDADARKEMVAEACHVLHEASILGGV